MVWSCTEIVSTSGFVVWKHTYFLTQRLHIVLWVRDWSERVCSVWVLGWFETSEGSRWANNAFTRAHEKYPGDDPVEKSACRSDWEKYPRAYRIMRWSYAWICLGKYRATLDCHQVRVQLETGPHPIQYQSLSPALRKVGVSAVQVNQMLRQGCEVFLTTTTTTEHGNSVDLSGISLVSRSIVWVRLQGK